MIMLALRICFLTLAESTIFRGAGKNPEKQNHKNQYAQKNYAWKM